MSEPPAHRPSHILVWLSGALGDTLLGYPALAALRAWAPRSSISVVGRPSYLAFAQRSGLIDTSIASDGALASALFSGAPLPAWPPFELAIVWSAAYQALADRLATLGVHSIIAAPPRPDDDRHQARYLLDTVRPLGIPRVVRPAPLPPLDPLYPTLHRLLGLENAPLVLLHPGSGARWKRWPLANWIALAQAISESDVSVAWSCGPADADLREALARRGMRTWPDLDLAGFAAALSQCALLVSPDTGVAHLAALLDRPQVVLFGPTDPRRWRPLGRQVTVVRAPDRCDGVWPPATGEEAMPRLLRRCPSSEALACRCLAALPPLTVEEACRARLANVRTS